ncbi:hypothetical protein SERLA73DRAFT_142359 [Serpula lacrymans var. lacrymans S7.3]|uniref:Uncharacterized protein n=2 Tax=Serpula lacrymans var. lacrymans TaxID=341189 RepID=F8Q7N4_SERL3|nr:uncharacterized protein SERLADRAFT_398395 [Serpula lacrymans var. lacrymans S7.9]EGN95572.1 hypothetical protein SERLA73DRAFT_142359 [Serpula lacrymans var. lacrymans S7.3]EGO21100.1 hypothetical protein SERLADRAFT_398395 [Serpula lacrymans var. lacrymans S7.9]
MPTTIKNSITVFLRRLPQCFHLPSCNPQEQHEFCEIAPFLWPCKTSTRARSR